MKTARINENNSSGRHTTTSRQLILLPQGGEIIDCPGIREVGLFGNEIGISNLYSDIENLISQCKFSNCSHTNEPGCAIQKALGNGKLTFKRWHNYQKLSEDNQWANSLNKDSFKKFRRKEKTN